MAWLGEALHLHIRGLLGTSISSVQCVLISVLLAYPIFRFIIVI